MSVLLVVLGFVLIVVALWDATSTMVSVEGGGPITSRIGQAVFRTLARLSPDPHSRVQSKGGEAISFLVILLWITLLWAGWTVIFLSASGAVVDTATGDPAGLVDTIYFAGFGLFTLGVGDFRPAPGFFQIATALSSLSGLFLVTVGISYLLSLTNAVAERRGVAAVISGLGHSGEEILRTSWNGRDFSGLEHQLATLASGVAALAEQHLAKPVLHYFHSPNRHTALEPSVVSLYEAVLLLQYAVEPGVRPRPPSLGATKAACVRLFEVYRQVFVRHPVDEVAEPCLDALEEAGIPLRPAADVRRDLEGERETRLLAASLLAESGWPPASADYDAPGYEPMRH
ncbi:MAG TPA: hypothetical protein VNU01_03135 [Egibacteraceae bacterium]|nr:hypothetical protein [Egibacteraceae bacterium]